MINFYELFNSIFINDFISTFGFFIISLGIVFIIFFIVFGLIFDNLDFGINILFVIIISVISTFFIIRVMEKRSKDKFYKITKINHLNINYEKFISEKKKLNDFCSERKLYSKYEDNFCKIETGNIVNDVFNFSEDTINKDTVNKVFNELYSTSNNKNKTKNKAVEEAIKFIKENKIQIKVNNKK